MIRKRIVPLALLSVACLAWREQDPRTEVHRFLDAGQYADAERVARAGGAPLSVMLGNVLVVRGKLAEAESTFAHAIDARAPDRLSAEAALAELAERRGDHAAASARARRIASTYSSANAPSSSDHMAAGRAYVLLMSGDASAARRALAAFDAATAADSNNFEAQRRTGDLFLSRHGNEDARQSYLAVLKRAPNDARAIMGIAFVEDFEGKGTALATIRRSLALNPQLSEALALSARLHLESEQYDSARVYAQRALSSDTASVQSWALLGATAFLTGDSATFRMARSSATALQPRPSEFYTELAEASIRQRRYMNANVLAQQAVALDSSSTHALTVLGANQLRLGQMAEGQATLDRAFKLDASDARSKNTLDLLDLMRSYRTIDTGRFRLVAPAKEAELLALYIVPLLERAFDSLSARYGYKPPTPVRIEFFDRSADFSVRTLGAVGLGALGVSFGSLLAMDAPSARERGTFNWGSTAWHELTHAFTLGASEHRVPRWLSEGMSVLEERRASPGWGASATVSFVGALGAGVLRPMSQLNDGFLHPRFAEETQFSYYQASLFCEMVEQTKGANALPTMLLAYRDGYDTPAVFQRVLGASAAQVDAQFDAWMRARFAVPLRVLTSKDTASEKLGAALTAVMQRAIGEMSRNQKDSAQRSLEQARAMFPEYGGDDGPSWFLALLARERGDTSLAIESVSEVTTRNETAWDANLLEADLRERRGDIPGALAALERLIWISPYEPSVHVRIAELSTSRGDVARGDFARAVRERRAMIALRPTDELDARYELAKALVAAGDVRGARRELLSVLEQAPSFEKAQALLLELRAKRSPGGTR